MYSSKVPHLIQSTLVFPIFAIVKSLFLLGKDTPLSQLLTELIGVSPIKSPNRYNVRPLDSIIFLIRSLVNDRLGFIAKPPRE